jgi:dTDP-4-dehydrorhamnose reductase
MASNKILVMGSYGQIGGSFRKLFGETGSVFYSDISSKDPKVLACDLANSSSIKKLLDDVRPTVIINCAAYTAVDLAEKEKDLAIKINSEAVQALAKEAEKLKAILIHYSTDYVFNGSGTEAWHEDSPTEPVNAYGHSKLLGEHAALEHCSKAYVFRTQWVYDNDGKNFLNTMLRLGREKEELSVVGDQIGAPTSSDVIARYTLKALTKITAGQMGPGIYNLVCRGEVSWHGFAEAIFNLAKEFGMPLKVKSVKKIKSADYPTPAKRPFNSRLSLKKLEEALGEPLPAWDLELARVIDARASRERLN